MGFISMVLFSSMVRKTQKMTKLRNTMGARESEKLRLFRHICHFMEYCFQVIRKRQHIMYTIIWIVFFLYVVMRIYLCNFENSELCLIVNYSSGSIIY